MKNSYNFSNSLMIFLMCFIFISFTLIILPLDLKFPSSGLDSSWRVALNEAIAQGFSFGKDILFTSGPYSSVYSRFYHPATYNLMLGGSLLFLLGYLTAVSRLMTPKKITILLGFIFLLIVLKISDQLFFSFLILFVVSIYSELTSSEFCINRNSCLTSLSIIFLLIPFGVFPLVKFSFFLMGFPILLLTMILLLLNKHKLFAFLTVLIPTITLCLLWVLASQKITALPGYFINSIDIVSGFSDSMSLPGNFYETLLYIICSCFLLMLILFDKSIKTVPRLYLFFCYSFLLFVMFKEGFVRHDGHAKIAVASFLIAIVASLLFLKPRILLDRKSVV